MTDIRRAWRALASTPRTSAVAVACLAGAIAAATAVFSIVDGVVLRPLPFRHAGRLVAIWGISPGRDTVKRGFSWPDARDAARDRRSLDGLAAIVNAPAGMTMTGQTIEPVQIPARIVSGNFFEVLGVPALAGRMLTADDDRPGSPAVVVISHALWIDRFGADPSIAGRHVTLDGRAFSIAGVAPRGFAYPPDARLWVTVAHGAPDYVDNRNVGWLEIIGLLKPGVSADQARADLARTFDDLATTYHPARGREALSVVPLERELVGDTRPALWALLAAVLVVLAVACANVGGLLLARGAARARDLAVRLALGAERGDLLRQACAEAVVLAAVSGAAGVALSVALVSGVRRFAPADIPRIADIAVDGRVLLFAIVVVTFAAIVCTIVPALQSTAGDVLSLLQQGGRSATANRALSRRLIAGAEIALSVVLIVAAVLVGRTFLNLRRVDVGFAADRVLAFDVPQPATRYPTATESLRFAARLSALAGVRHSASVLLRPLWGVAGMDWPVVIDGQSPRDAAQNPLTNLEAISAGYFDTLGIPIVEGRDIRDDDREPRPGAAIVGQSFARRFWPDGRVLGRRLKLPLPGSPYNGQWFTVVGVVGDAKYREIRGQRLDLYISAAQCPYAVHQFVVRTDARTDLRPDTIVSAIRVEVRALDPDLPIDDVVVLGDEVSRAIASPRFVAIIFVAFAATATALAAVGLATLIAWQVAQRTREIGIRIALGATPPAVVRAMMVDGSLIVLSGVAVGLTVAISVTTFLRSLLYEISPHDPVTLTAAAGVAAAIGLLSAYLPARRASHIEPLVALREE